MKRAAKWQTIPTMSNVLEMESAISRLPLVEQQVIRDWLEDQIEGQLAVSEGFKAKIERAQRELMEGIQSRERRPDNAS